MRKHLLTAALGGVLSLIVGASGALADYTFPQQPNQLAIRLGAIFPTVNNAQTFGGTTQFLGGLDYTLSATRGNSPSSTGLYFDYQSGSHNAGYLHSGGLGVQYRTMWPMFVGGGVGVGPGDAVGVGAGVALGGGDDVGPLDVEAAGVGDWKEFLESGILFTTCGETEDPPPPQADATIQHATPTTSHKLNQ